jgi:CheY-like chemotaxis protein
MFIGFSSQDAAAACVLGGGSEVEDAVVVPGPGESSNPVILVVEDDVLVRFITAEILREAGFSVLEAVNSSEALALLSTGHPLDLVITDIRMPGAMDGVQLSSVLKAARPNLPIALLSSHLERPNHQADVFVSKPYDPDHLVEVVKRLIGAEWRSNISSPNVF